MKKYIQCSLCALIIAILCAGCNNDSVENMNEGDLVSRIHVTSNNDIFTDEFFNGLKEIHLLYFANAYADKPLTSEEDMQKVCDILAGLTFTEKDFELYVGSIGLKFTFADGNEESIAFTSAVLYYGDKAFIPDKDICEEIEAIFKT